MNTTKLVRELKEAGQDMEFYPTTTIILEALGQSIKEEIGYNYHQSRSFLDIGAGSGKVINFARDLRVNDSALFYTTYGIEKSQILINQWDKDHLILGVDFHKTTLLDKKVDYLYCNPPYSQFNQWAAKIIKEAPSKSIVYLLMPTRWKDDQLIKDSLAARKHELEVVGNFSFENSEDRKARAVVDLVIIKMKETYGEEDPFETFFNENFTYPEEKAEEKFEDKVEQTKLVKNTNLIETLCFLHDEELNRLNKNFGAICELDPDLLKEFEITREGLIESLKMKISTIKGQYWNRLFDNLDKIKERLTKNSREKIVGRMQANVGIEFNRENAYSVVLYVIKHANDFFDTQLIDTYEKMVNFANVESYKSNKKVFEERSFEYHYKDDLSHFKLKTGHRIVLDRCGGLYSTSWSWETGLEESAANFIGDLMTIANNLGFKPLGCYPKKGEWNDSKSHGFYCSHKGEEKVLLEVKAFKNGNLHLKLLPEFVHSMNISHGRLKKWIYTPEQAAEEADNGAELFSIDFKLGEGQLLLN